MTTFLFIRHAAHDLLGRVLAGRAPDVHLNARGRIQAEELADRLSSKPIARVHTSPLERACETAWPLASRLGLSPEVNAAFQEIDFGEWTAQPFSALEPLPEWQRWNAKRGSAQAPGGETMAGAQRRAVEEMIRLAAGYPHEVIAVFSHGDLIKALLMHCLEIPLDHILRLEVYPGSTSTVTRAGEWMQVVSINDTGLREP